MTDIEHAKKYAEESISLAISMYNPKAESIAEIACLYGLTYKNEQIADLEKENKVLAQNLEDTEIINNAYEKKLTKAKEIIKYLLSFIQKENYKTRWDINITEAEQFLSEVEK